MMVGICLGTWTAAGFLSLSENATTALGFALVLYAVSGLISVRMMPARAEPLLSPVVGAITGAITAATGVFVIPAVPYLQAVGLERDQLVQALGLSFTISTLALAVNLASQGSLPADVALDSGLALIPALAGMWAGQLIRTRTKPAVFRVWFFVGLLLLGGHLSLRSVL
jgi:uncharacterized membrane protein YfcA